MDGSGERGPDGIRRRELLARGAAAAAGVAAAGPLVAAADALARRPAPDWRLGFRSLRREVRIGSLPVDGRLPPWLGGTLVRNGPALFEQGDARFRHWFDGLAMLHAFSFRAGRVGYANRFLRSSQHAAVTTEGRIRYSEFATDPCRAIFNGAAAMFVPAPVPNANVHVDRLRRRFVALTEIPLPVQFDPVTLRTLGVRGQAPLAVTGTAHPHADPPRGERYAFTTRLAPPSGYDVLVSERGSPDRILATIPEGQPGYMHSFALTARHAILAEFPFRLDPLETALHWKPIIENFAWHAGQPARFHVVDRGTGRVRTLETEPYFAFHHVNAFEAGGRLWLDVCAYPDPGIIRSLYLDKLRGPAHRVPQAELRRYELDLGTGRVRHRRLSDVPIELPRINYERVNARAYRYAYGTGLRDPGRSGFIDQIVKVDVETGAARTWREAGTFPGEPVFVAAPGARREDDGAVLSVVLDARAGRSFLLVLDARSFREVARARVPHHIPYGFHGRVV